MFSARFIALVLVSCATILAQNLQDPALVIQPHGLVDRTLGLFRPAEPSHLTGPERLKLYVLNTVGPVPLLGEAASAGLQQWADSPPEWRQGWGGYGRRFVNNMGYNAVRQSISYGLSTALHQDTRYFAATQNTVWGRARHAMVSTFTARRDDGSETFSVSGTAGVIGAASIASLWGPPSWQGAHNIAKNAAISFAATAGFNLIREFVFRSDKIK